MRVEILYFDGCPNHEPLVARLESLLNELGVDDGVRYRRVDSDRAAVALGFLGSPTVRVEGRDVEPGAELRSDYGLKCRLYRTPAGLAGQPPDEWIRAAISPTRG